MIFQKESHYYDRYEFAHKSLQEYLAADYIVRLPAVELVGKVALELPNELAIATSLSSRPGAYLTSLFFRAVDLNHVTPEWLDTFVHRLELEKPELQIGASVFSAIAAMHLLEKLDRVDYSHTAFSYIVRPIPHNILALIFEYYEISQQSQKYTFFTRTKLSLDYRIPESLRVAKVVLRTAAISSRKK